MPLLQLAGPMTGLIIQPLIGALSDRTGGKWGRRTPYFLIGAVLCALGLVLMPLSSSLVMAVLLLWILDAGAPGTIKAFRDPFFFRDPVTAADHIVFTATAAWSDDPHNGMVGFATRTAVGWVLDDPLIDAVGVNNELERAQFGGTAAPCTGWCSMGMR